MDVRDYARIIGRRWALILVFVLVAVGLSAAYSVTATPQYESVARLFVSTSQANTAEAYEGSLLSDQRALSYAELTKSRDLAQTVITDLDLALSPEELVGRVQAEVLPETVNMVISITDPDPDQARALTQAYADGLTDLVANLETPPGEKVPPIKLTVIDNASEPAGPVSPDPVRNALFAAFIGLILGIAAAIIRELSDTTVKTLEDLSVVGAPLLASIAFDSSTKKIPLITELGSHTPRVEAFRVLRTNLQFVDVDREDKVFVVSSAVPSEGKTSTSINLALAIAQAGQRTLLIEGDLRRPRASRQFNLDNAIGVTTVLLGQVTLDDATQTVQGSELRVLASGSIPPNPAELIQSNAMTELLNEARRKYDVVIIDAPPLLPVTDAALFAAQSDGALVVVRYGKTTKEQLSQLVDRLKQVDAAPVGVVMNMVPPRSDRAGYGYGYGYAPDSATVTAEAAEPEKVLGARRR
ncbi:polysaccharide biosynthesis tyrosine autokinase [Nocardioides dongkuii]|uniref:polysaccharide biosynthesis tyrosine autokinase n=1 Tax=Nocardioides dongkuii TaxID=2760089 RepID=UPI0015FC571B|nr:polysaccharide biosynthesis tyrosine autokinase [Nocardioides dongkuii]